jgi:TRAP-type C4-dicarboxylate transport system permease small subunit
MFIVPVLYRDKGLIQMHLIEGIIGKKSVRYLDPIVDFIILALLVYLLPVSISLCAGQIDMLSRGLGIPRIYITLPVPIGALLTLLVGVSNSIHQIPNLRYET